MGAHVIDLSVRLPPWTDGRAGSLADMNDDELATVASFSTRGEAEVARAMLAASGIEAVVRPDDEGGLNPGFYRDYGVRIVVRSSEAVEARAALEQGLDE